MSFYNSLTPRERNEIRAWARGEQWLSNNLECAVHYWLVDSKNCSASISMDSDKASILTLEVFGDEDEATLRVV